VEPQSITTAYADLRADVAARGLLAHQPRYYAVLGGLLLGGVGLGYAVLVLAPSPAIQLVNAVFLAFVYGQVSLLAHDASHRQVFPTARGNELLGLVLVLVQGLSWSWWVDKHLRHHRAPNVAGEDPDIEVPGLAFTRAQAESRGWVGRAVIRHLQSRWFVPILAAQTVGWTIASARFLLTRRVSHPWAELGFFVAHHVLYAALVVAALGPLGGLGFALVHKGLWSLYLSSILAPNHQGMPIVVGDLDFPTRQIVTTRSVGASPWTELWFGGLNHHVEHHLFPTMPRNNLEHVRPLVRAFCARVGLPYAETGVAEANRQIAVALRGVSQQAR
jgi:fatty acid desaturase